MSDKPRWKVISVTKMKEFLKVIVEFYWGYKPTTVLEPTGEVDAEGQPIYVEVEKEVPQVETVTFDQIPVTISSEDLIAFLDLYWTEKYLIRETIIDKTNDLMNIIGLQK